MYAERETVLTFPYTRLSVCLSVRPSKCRYCVLTNRHIVTLFDGLVGASF